MGEVSRQEFAEAVDGVAAGEAVKHGGDVGFWVQAVQLCGLGDGVDDGGVIAACV